MINTIAYVTMIESLINGPVSKFELCDTTGLGAKSIKTHIDLLHKRKLIRIAEWRRNSVGKNWVPHFEINVEGLSDARKPPRLSSVERSKRYRERQRTIKINQLFGGML